MKANTVNIQSFSPKKKQNKKSLSMAASDQRNRRLSTAEQKGILTLPQFD